MSEYQYYEFVAIDRRLTQSEMAELRQLTSRATVTPTRLQNVYNWGNFKGKPEVLMEKYFDVPQAAGSGGSVGQMDRRRAVTVRIERKISCSSA